MPYKSRIKIITCGFLLAIMAGCNLPDASTTTPSTPPIETTVIPTTEQLNPELNPGETCDNTLFPVKQGATWTYVNTGSPAGTFNYTDTITNVRSDGFTVTSQFSDLIRTQEWACKPEGLQAVQLGETIAMALSTQGISADLTTSDVTGVTLPVNITLGMQWSYGFGLQGTITYEGQKADANGTVTTTLEEAGSETITVPAGTFDATRIQATSSFDLTASYFGFEVPVDYATTSTLWYAPGVGLVKLVESSNLEGTSFSSTTELQTYNIP